MRICTLYGINVTFKYHFRELGNGRKFDIWNHGSEQLILVYSDVLDLCAILLETKI